MIGIFYRKAPYLKGKSTNPLRYTDSRFGHADLHRDCGGGTKP